MLVACILSMFTCCFYYVYCFPEKKNDVWDDCSDFLPQIAPSVGAVTFLKFKKKMNELADMLSTQLLVEG